MDYLKDLEDIFRMVFVKKKCVRVQKKEKTTNKFLIIEKLENT